MRKRRGAAGDGGGVRLALPAIVFSVVLIADASAQIPDQGREAEERRYVAAYARLICSEAPDFRGDLHAPSYRTLDRRPLDAGDWTATDREALPDGSVLTLEQTPPAGSGRFFTARVTWSGKKATVWESEQLAYPARVRLRTGGGGVLLVLSDRLSGDRCRGLCEDRFSVTHSRWDGNSGRFIEVARYESRHSYLWGTFAHVAPPSRLPKCY